MTDLLFENLEIRQYRAFDYLNIERLGHVNLILGRNNIGKSTLLEALYLNANAGSPQTIQTILNNRDELNGAFALETEQAIRVIFHSFPPLDRITTSIQIGRIDSPDSALSISILWPHRKSDMEYLGVSGDQFDHDDFSHNQENFEMGTTSETVHDRLIPAIMIKQGTFRRILALRDNFDGICRDWQRQSLRHSALMIPCIFFGPNGFDGEHLRQLWDKIVLTDAKQDVIEAMRIISPEIDDFALTDTRQNHPTIRLKIKGHGDPIPLKRLGDGMNRLFGIGLAMAVAKNGMVLIDEVENGIHWSVLPEVWKLIVRVAKRLNVQVFATTHSNDCLKAFYFGCKDDPSVEGIAVRIEKKNDEFNAEIFDKHRLAVIAREGIEIR